MRVLFDVNVFGIQRVLRATLPTFRAQRSGLVINIGSPIEISPLKIGLSGRLGARRKVVMAPQTRL